MMAWLLKVILVVGCLLGIYVFLMSISPKGRLAEKKAPILKPITLITSITPIQTAITTPTTALANSIEVIFDGSKFSPAEVELTAGNKIMFRNNSQTGIWIVSNPHSIHNLYSELNSGGVILPGKSFEFAPSKLGVWSYHADLQDGNYTGISGSIRVK